MHMLRSTGWSGIAVGPIDVIFEGILPYTVPLFFSIPFHEYTVNAVNAILTLHACILHSSCHGQYEELNGLLGYFMISPIGHNMHHQYGLNNACNFAPIFKIWDRLPGTLNEKEPFWWKRLFWSKCQFWAELPFQSKWRFSSRWQFCINTLTVLERIIAICLVLSPQPKAAAR